MVNITQFMAKGQYKKTYVNKISAWIISFTLFSNLYSVDTVSVPVSFAFESEAAKSISGQLQYEH